MFTVFYLLVLYVYSLSLKGFITHQGLLKHRSLSCVVISCHNVELSLLFTDIQAFVRSRCYARKILFSV